MKQAKIGLADMLEIEKETGKMEERKRMRIEIMKRLDKFIEDVDRILEGEE